MNDTDLSALPLAVDGLPTLHRQLKSHGIEPRKALGQNFLLDLSLTCKIARAACLDLAQTVIEVGPGPGGLSRALLMEGAQEVIAIEKDGRLSGLLDGIAQHYPDRFRVIDADATYCDITKLGQEPRMIVANLPYNVGTALLVQWLLQLSKEPQCFVMMTLLFQKEVAQRITAQVGDKAYGRLSILSRWLCDCEMLFDIPATAFVPAPKVTSSLVQLRPRAEPLYPASLPLLEKITAAAFAQRRKMLRQSLKQLATALNISAQEFCEQAEISPTARAEQIDIAGFCRLAQLYEKLEQALL